VCLCMYVCARTRVCACAVYTRLRVLSMYAVCRVVQRESKRKKRRQREWERESERERERANDGVLVFECVCVCVCVRCAHVVESLECALFV